MDFDCTAAQARVTTSRIDPATRIVILPTGDREGEAFAERLFIMLGRNRWVRCVELEEGAHPTDIAPADLVARLPV